MTYSMHCMGFLDSMKGYPELFLSVASALCFLLITYSIGRRRSRLPMNWPLIGVLPSVIANIKRFHEFATILLRQTKGTVVVKGSGSLGTKLVFTCDPANANHILNLHFKNYPQGHDFGEILDILGEGIFCADGESWKTQRKMALSVLMGMPLQSFLVQITRAKVETALISFLNNMSEKGMVFDLQDVILRFTFDTNCSFFLGVDLGSLSPDLPTIPFAKACSDAEQVIFFRHIVPTVWWKLLRRLNLWQEKKMRAAWEVIDQFLAMTIKENSTAANAATTSILRTYLDRDYSQSDKFLRDTMLTFISAGKDTTGAALSWFFWLVSKNPKVEERILQELRDQVKGSHTSYDKLVYLQACLCETLRLYPSVPFIHKQCSDPDVLPSGHKVSRGMEIIISIYSMGRMKWVWGEDCLEFKPERWISQGNLRNEPSYKFLAFNSGPKSCLGKDIAFTQMKIVAAAMIYNFEIQVVEDQLIEPDLSIVLHMKNGLKVKVKKRSGV